MSYHHIAIQWLKFKTIQSKTITVQNAREGTEKLGHSYIDGGSVKWHRHCEAVRISSKIKHASTIQPSDCTIGHLY